jgi:hypothetical protein
VPSRDTANLSVRELLGVYVAVLEELLKRSVIRTRNAPLGDLAEHIVWRAFGGQIERNSKKSYDVLDRMGRRIQVKARLVVDQTDTQFSAVRSWDFDVAIFIVLDATTYEISWARELTLAQAESLGRHVVLTNSRAIRAREVAGLGNDVTDRIRAAFDGLDLA